MSASRRWSRTAAPSRHTRRACISRVASISRAQPLGVRPLRIHDARHTWATFALHAGKNIRWVSDQLGHADPAFTLRVYAHALREEETDLAFAEFGGLGRPNTAQFEESEFGDPSNYADSMARREGFEPPTLRFEA